MILPNRAILNPAEKGFPLLPGKGFPGIGRGHSLTPQLVGNALVKGAIMRISPDDGGWSLPAFPKGPFLDIQPEIGLAGFGVGTVTGVTIFR